MLRDIMDFKTTKLWHPESAGSKVTVTRSWLGRLLKPTCFATIGECLKDGIHWMPVPKDHQQGEPE